MNNPIFLGVDAGTTRIKAALVDHEGHTLAEAACDAEVLKPQEGWCEMDMDALWKGLCRIINQLRDNCRAQEWNRLAGVGITAQGDGLWAIDSDGRPVGNAILWNDTRTRDFALPNRDAVDTLLVQNNATPLFAGAMPLLLAWLKAKEPQRYARAARVFHCKDWLNYNLTGVAATDYTDAGSSSAVDIFSKAFLPECFALMGIAEAVDLQPPLYPSTQVIGHVTEDAAVATGLPAGIAVIAGIMDIIAVQLGAGATNIGDKCTILGTTLCNEVIIGRDQVDHTDTHGSVQCNVGPDSYVRVMAAQSGMSTVDWAKGLLAPELTFNELEKELAKRPVGAGGIIYHPYLYGERAPFKNSNACAGFYGLTVRHDRFDLMRAVYEGVVFSLRNCYDHLPGGKGTLYVSGGGSKSDFLCQLAADMLGQPVARPAAKELGIAGIITALRMGLGYPPAAANGSAAEQRFFPQAGIGEALRKPYQGFLDLQREIAPFWDTRLSWK